MKLNKNTFEDEETVIKALVGRLEGLEHVWTIGHTLLCSAPAGRNPAGTRCRADPAVQSTGFK